MHWKQVLQDEHVVLAMQFFFFSFAHCTPSLLRLLTVRLEKKNNEQNEKNTKSEMTLDAMEFKRLVIFVRMFRVNALDFVSLTIQELCSFHMAFNFNVIGVQMHENPKGCVYFALHNNKNNQVMFNIVLSL